jgi:hypothetical protein
LVLSDVSIIGPFLRRGALQNDLTKLHLALGGELLCDELERRIKLQMETESRAAEARAHRFRARRLGDFNRQKARSA